MPSLRMLIPIRYLYKVKKTLRILADGLTSASQPNQPSRKLHENMAKQCDNVSAANSISQMDNNIDINGALTGAFILTSI
jgi:hypothetical protein